MSRLFNLNSLTDIVSNAIGIAILLALVTFITSISRTHEVVVPVAQESALVPRFYVIDGGALWPIDRSAILRAIAERSSEPGSFELRLPDGTRAEIEVTNDAGFLVRHTSTESWTTARGAFADLDREREQAFLFVYDGAESFAALREARRLLTARGVRTGWTVVTREHPPHVCASPESGACSYRPAL
jgi:hypothetical protein